MATPFFVLGIAILICAYVSKRIATSFSNFLLRRRLGCRPIRRVPQPERIIGYELYRTQVTALKNKNSLDVNLRRYMDNGVTWSVVMMGKTFINTIDPENVQALLATNFKDFGLAERRSAFGPLLGKGIFTTDGKGWEHSRVSQDHAHFTIQSPFLCVSSLNLQLY